MSCRPSSSTPKKRRVGDLSTPSWAAGEGSEELEEDVSDRRFFRRGKGQRAMLMQVDQHNGIPLSPSIVLAGAGQLTGQQQPVVHITVNQQPPVINPIGSTVLPDYFPTTLPITRLTAAERRHKYGLGIYTPTLVKEQIKDFVKWSTNAVELSRAGTYSAAVQFTTTEKQETCILAYLGYLANVRTDVSDERLDMSAYDQPKWIAGFISYLMARDVGRGHVIKHISLARKVNNWLVSGEWDERAPHTCML